MIRVPTELLHINILYMYNHEPDIILEIAVNYNPQRFLATCLVKESNSSEVYVYLIDLLKLQRLNLGIGIGKLSNPYISLLGNLEPIVVRDEGSNIRIRISLSEIVNQIRYASLPYDYIKYIVELLEHYVLKYDLEQVLGDLYNCGYDGVSTKEILEMTNQHIKELISKYPLDSVIELE